MKKETTTKVVFPTHLVIVPGHALLKASVERQRGNLLNEDLWALHPFQRGEVKSYLEHIKAAVECAASDTEALLVFSGTFSRKESGLWSEALSYRALTEHFNWWDDSVADNLPFRTVEEEYARDSFENLFFSICRFWQHARYFPRRVTVFGWKFKAERFYLHRKAICYPEDQFKYIGINNPANFTLAIKNERKVIKTFADHPFGISKDILIKREQRNPKNLCHPYSQTPGLKEFFKGYNSGSNSIENQKWSFPWDQS